MDASYWREWRASHPEYRARQNVLRAARRALKGRGDRSSEYAKRPSRAVAPIEPFVRTEQHPLFDAAAAIVGIRSGSLTSLYDPLYDDLVSEAVLALLEQAAGNPVDPAKVVREYRAREIRLGRTGSSIFLTDDAESSIL